MAAPLELALLVLAAMGAGALNSVAGGGSFLTFPALLAVGVPAISANATSGVALWPAGLASAAGYRDALAATRRLLPALAAVSALGGLLGALALLWTPPTAFGYAVPWLLLSATVAFAAGTPLVARLRRRRTPRGSKCRQGPLHGFYPLLAVQFAISLYGGYFGGGMGVLMLAAFALIGITDIHAMNGLKVLLAVAIKTVAVVAFALAGIVAWPLAALMVAGGAVGGYAGARLARRIDARVLRGAVVVAGLLLSAYYFLHPPV